MATLPSYRAQPQLTSSKVKALLRSRYVFVILFPVILFVLWLQPQNHPIFSSRGLERPVRVQQDKAYRLSKQKARPTCEWTGWHTNRYAPLLPLPPPAATKNIYLALNLMNNEDVLPTFFQELPLLLKHLGPEHVYVSIYENGSEDRTPELLHICTHPYTSRCYS